ncbi:MAG: hypothetical protein R3E13_11915 [Alphaproteobacteria bacterium]
MKKHQRRISQTNGAGNQTYGIHGIPRHTTAEFNQARQDLRARNLFPGPSVVASVYLPYKGMTMPSPEAMPHLIFSVRQKEQGDINTIAFLRMEYAGTPEADAIKTDYPFYIDDRRALQSMGLYQPVMLDLSEYVVVPAARSHFPDQMNGGLPHTDYPINNNRLRLFLHGRTPYDLFQNEIKPAFYAAREQIKAQKTCAGAFDNLNEADRTKQTRQRLGLYPDKLGMF